MTRSYWFYEREEGDAEPSPLTLKSLMTRDLLALHPKDLVLDAMTLMSEKGVRHIPIVSKEEGRLEGLITEVDIFRNVLHGKKMTEEETYHATLDVMLELGEVMMTNLETLPPEAHVADAVALFLDRKIRCVPIMDSNKKLVGIVTETDMMKLLQHMVDG